MRKSAFYSLHTFIIFLFIVLIIFEGDQLSDYHGDPFSFCLLDSLLFFGYLLGVTYFSYWLFIPKFLIKKEYWKFILGLLTIVLGFTLLFYISAIFMQKVTHLNLRLFVPGMTGMASSLGFTMGMAGTFFRLFIEWIKDINAKNELEKQNFKSELSLLKGQLNPHFLFNTLNNIDSLIHQNSPNASLALNKLSEIMRYVVYDSEKTLVPLEDEIIYLKNYISLQKLRIPNENIIQFQINGDPGNKLIAPMLFIPFVENSFKHASLKDKPENTVKITIDINATDLRFYCLNTVSGIPQDRPGGIGLPLVKKRLELIYMDRYFLDIKSSEKLFSVNLEIKLA